MKHTWKKTTAFIMALALVAGFAPANVGAFLTGGTAIVASAAETVEEEPAAVAATVERNGLTYYNTYSENTDSAKMFYQDLIDGKYEGFKDKYAPTSNLFSIGDEWLMLAAGLYPKPGFDYGKSTHYLPGLEAKLGYTPGTGDDFSYAYIQPAKWVNTNDGGYVEKTLVAQWGDGAADTYIARFSNFKVVTIMPENTGNNYVSTKFESVDTSSAYASSFKNDSAVEASGTQALSSSTEYSLSNSISGSKSLSFSEGFEAASKFEILGAETEFKASFSATQAIEKGWENGESLSDSTSSDSSVSVTLPPYTNSMLKQSVGVTNVTTRYNCPVAIKYTVELLKVRNGKTTTIATFGETDGDARADLYQRGILERSDNSDRQINWEGSLFTEALIEVITANVPMSGFGATMTETLKTVNTVAAPIAPLYPLTDVKTNIRSVNMNVGDVKSLDEFELTGLNYLYAPYYGFNSVYGHWTVVDAGGNALSGEEAPIKIVKDNPTGEETYEAVKDGTAYLKYMIDENSYATAENIDTYTTNADLRTTAVVKVTVTEDTSKPKVTASNPFTGHVGKEPVSLDDYFNVEFTDSTGKDVDYIWEAKETTKKGIVFDENNEVSFTKPGTFHVRVVDPDDKNSYSDWVKITAEVYGDDWEAPEDVQEPVVEADYGTTFEITGSYTGLVGAEPDAIEGEPSAVIYDNDGTKYYSHGRLQVNAFDDTGKEINVAHTWEAMETDGITITEDGNISFTKPGTYHVCIKSGDFYSDWYEITAAETSEEYSTISFLNFDGSLIENIIQPWGSAVTAPIPPEIEEYVFVGWSDEVPETMPADDLELYAQWQLDPSIERVLILGNTRGSGNLAVSEDGSEPVFEDEYPLTSLYNNVIKGETVIFSAKAKEGWVFKEWQHRATGEVYSKDVTISITAETPLDLVAVFDTEDAVEHQLTDAELMQWSQKDYQDKTGITANVAITGWSDNEYNITLTDDDENVLDIYAVDPDTGIGTNEAGEKVDLPKTGMSGVHKAIAGLAAIMTLTGVALVKRSRKEDED